MRVGGLLHAGCIRRGDILSVRVVRLAPRCAVSMCACAFVRAFLVPSFDRPFVRSFGTTAHLCVVLFRRARKRSLGGGGEALV